MEKETLIDHVAGCLLGMAIGDALGRMTEGMTPYQVIKKYNFVDGFFKIDGEYGRCSQETRLSLSLANAINQATIIDQAFFKKLNDTAKSNGIIADPKYGSAKALMVKAVPIGIYASLANVAPKDIYNLCKMSTESTHHEKHERLASAIIADLIRECIKNYGTLTRPFDLYDSEGSLLNQKYFWCVDCEHKWDDNYSDSVSERLSLVRSKLMKRFSLISFAGFNGTSSNHFETLALSVFAFLSEPDEFKTVLKVVNLGGASTINGAIVGALIGGYLGASMLELKDQVEGSAKIQTLASDLVEKYWRPPVEERDPTEEFEVSD